MHNSMSNNIPLIQSMYLMDLLSMLGICKMGHQISDALAAQNIFAQKTQKCQMKAALTVKGFHERLTVFLYAGGLWNRSLMRMLMLFVIFRAITLILFWKK